MFASAFCEGVSITICSSNKDNAFNYGTSTEVSLFCGHEHSPSADKKCGIVANYVAGYSVFSPHMVKKKLSAKPIYTHTKKNGWIHLGGGGWAPPQRMMAYVQNCCSATV